MSLEQHPKLQEIIDSGYELDMGRYISGGIDIFKKNIGGFVGYTALFLGILVVAGLIPFIGFIASLILTPTLSAGFYLVAHKLHRGEMNEFGDFFRGFDYTGHLVIAYLLMIVAFVLLMGPFFYGVFASGMFDPEVLLEEEIPTASDFPWWTLLTFIPMIYLAIAWRWAPLFIIFYNMNFWDAMETSRKLMHKKWGMMFLFAFLIGLLGGIGYIALFIGILFTYPAAMCMDYAAFADVTRLMQTESEESNDIADHLVE